MMIDKDRNFQANNEINSVPPINFRLDAKSGVPTYLQLVHQVEHALRLGYLQLGDQLPRVKDVVGSLSINPNTVIKAYADLEGKGIAVGRPGRGTFIISVTETIGLVQLNTLRQSLKHGWLRTAGDAGLDENDIVALFTSTLREFIVEEADVMSRRDDKGNEVIA
jgi:GntR family transcriptional regulator